jgi:hypothetical protein
MVIQPISWSELLRNKDKTESVLSLRSCSSISVAVPNTEEIGKLVVRDALIVISSVCALFVLVPRSDSSLFRTWTVWG